MRFSVLILLLLLSGNAIAQSVNFEDDFSNRELSQWTGTKADFIFIEEDENVMLQQHAEGAGTSYLSAPSNKADGYWEFFIRMDFAPSESNRAEIYLMSDIPDLNGAVNGYMLKAGENGSGDVFRLFRITNGSEDIEVLSGTTDLSGGGDFRVKVSRSAAGQWTLEAAPGYDGLLTEKATGFDDTYTTASHFGFKTTYTSTRANRFSFDFKIDIPLVYISQLEVVGEQEIALSFSREVDPNTIDNADFNLNPNSVTPMSVAQPAPDSLLLKFRHSLTGGKYGLHVQNLRDLPHQTTLKDTLIDFMVFDEFETDDIIINEFMKDPPDGAAEYIELWNNSSRYLNLKNWQIGDNRSLTEISANDFGMSPGSHLVFSADTALLKQYFGPGEYHQLPLPALNNTTDQIRLYDAMGTPIDSLQYEPDWGGDEIALERKSAEVAGIYRENWGVSPAVKFGTPGHPNDIPPDVTPPLILDIVIPDAQTLLLITSERLEQTRAENIQNYQLSADPNVGPEPSPLPSVISSEQITSDTLRLSLDNALSEFDGRWKLAVQSLTDIFGNERPQTIEFAYYQIFTAQQGQVAINEFMYDPAAGFSEFIELYNHSDSSFDLRDWTLNDNSGNPGSISTSPKVLPKNDYLVLAPDSSLLELFPNIPVLVMHSRFPALNNSADDIVIRNADGVLIDSLSYTSDWGGDEIALERRLSRFPAIYKENWGHSPSAAKATPGQANVIQPDQKPPSIQQINRLHADLLQIIFSERIQKTPAENISNYSVEIMPDASPLPAIKNARFQAPDTVLLSFDTSLPVHPEGSVYHFALSGMKDIFGNRAERLTDSLLLIEYHSPAPSSISVNEFMYDPPDEYPEFIELYNHGEQAVNLRGWTFNDNTGNRRVISDTDQPLLPGAFMVITPDSSLHRLFPDIPLIAMGSRFASLNNSADAIVIRDANGHLLDSLSYSSDWGGEETSLERRSTGHPGYYRENWGNSPAPQGASPGKANLIPPDEMPPGFTDVTIISPDTLSLHFSERIDSSLAVDMQHYQTSPAVPIRCIVFQEDVVLLALSQPLQDGVNYTITVTNQQDVFGNKLHSSSLSIDYTEFSPARSADIIINEVLYRRADADSEEFVELYNRSDKNINLGGWQLQDATSSTNFPEQLALRSGAYLVVTDSEIFAEQTGSLYLPGFPSLNDDEDRVVLKNNTGMIIDSLHYRSHWGGNQAGTSLERLHPEAPTNDGSKWATSKAEAGHSAGAESSVFESDGTPPEIIYAHLITENTVRVIFSEFVDINQADFQINDEKVLITSYNPEQANRVMLAYEGNSSGEPMTLQANGVMDFAENHLESSVLPVAVYPKPGDLVINEIMYNPLADANDKLPDQPEYLEVYNTSKQALSLEGIYLHNRPDENGNVRSLHPNRTEYQWVRAEGYAVIHAEPSQQGFEESQLAKYFQRSVKDKEEAVYLPLTRSGLSFGNAEDAVYLADSSGTVIDSVYYADDWQNPNLHDTKGIALEKINPHGPGNDAANWSSSTHVSGGTPGLQNSIYQAPGMIPTGTVINFSPDPFSPDGDGFEDHLLIQYQLGEPDYLLRIRIFDRYGRKVRTLAESKPAGLEGTLIWDGFTDNGRRNRIGYYIILFEAYNSQKGKKITRKKTVVLARKF